MPKELKFRSEAAQSAAIGIVMAIALSGSMVLAYALTTSQQKKHQDDNIETKRVIIGPLTLSIPTQFQKTQKQHPVIGFDFLIEFDDRLDPKQKLQIAAMGKPRPENTLAALYRALSIMLIDELQQGLQPWNRVAQFSNDETTGAWYTGVSRSRETTQIHLLGVLTGEGQRYWMIYLSHEIGRPESLNEATDSATRLFEVVMGNATWHNQPNRSLPTSL